MTQLCENLAPFQNIILNISITTQLTIIIWQGYELKRTNLVIKYVYTSLRAGDTYIYYNGLVHKVVSISRIKKNIKFFP